jgi:hypothetical protein
MILFERDPAGPVTWRGLFGGPRLASSMLRWGLG